MRTILWLTLLFACAVAAALFAGSNEGQVLLLWPPWQVDISANLAIALLLLAFVLLHALLRTSAHIAHIPALARRWRARRKERAMHQQLLQAALHFFGGRFGHARKAALAALALQQTLPRGHGLTSAHVQQLRCMARLLAIEAAHELQEAAPPGQTHWDALLQDADACPQALGAEVRAAAHLRAAHRALQAHDAALALQHLAQLPAGVARRTHALRLRLKAEHMAHDHTAAMASARRLARHRALSATAADSLVQTLVLESLAATTSSAALHSLWQNLEARQRAQPPVACAAAARLLHLGGMEGLPPPEVATRARAWLLPAWEAVLRALESAGQDPAGPDTPGHLAHLVQGLQESLAGLDGVWLARIEAAASHHPNQPALQYLAGMACVERALWGKARQLLRQCAETRPPLPGWPALLHSRAWQQLAHMAEHSGHMEEARHAWRQAAPQAPDAATRLRCAREPHPTAS